MGNTSRGCQWGVSESATSGSQSPTKLRYSDINLSDKCKKSSAKSQRGLQPSNETTTASVQSTTREVYFKERAFCVQWSNCARRFRVLLRCAGEWITAVSHAVHHAGNWPEPHCTSKRCSKLTIHSASKISIGFWRLLLMILSLLNYPVFNLPMSRLFSFIEFASVWPFSNLGAWFFSICAIRRQAFCYKKYHLRFRSFASFNSCGLRSWMLLLFIPVTSSPSLAVDA